MARKTAKTLPLTEALLVNLGLRLRAARLRRGLSAATIAARAGMSLMTLRAVERGRPGATMGAYLSVLQTLGFEKTLDQVAADDPIGHGLQDAARQRAPRTKKTTRTTIPPAPPRRPSPSHSVTDVSPRSSKTTTSRSKSRKTGAARSDDLLSLITGRKTS
jgi:transcriptional regulator with XRE-family HTH domain